MCEKAEEIQALNNWVRCNFYFHPKDGNIVTIGEECRDFTVVIDVADGSRFALDDPVIWLPRQDQLQEMVDSDWSGDLIRRFYVWCKEYGFTTKAIASMEQLWLGFVMHSLYSKRWDGETWINHNI